MEFNKCTQCGAFFLNTGKLCPNCTTKDSAKIQKLENYLDDYSAPITLNSLSYNTGIPEKDLLRYIKENNNLSKYNNFISL